MTGAVNKLSDEVLAGLTYDDLSVRATNGIRSLGVSTSANSFSSPSRRERR
jgi:hypothetical protein